MIYAIRCSISGHIKFGKAKNPKRRIDTLQIGNPGELQIMALANWPDDEEYRIHAYLDADWVRGEWFRRTIQVDKVIAMLRDDKAGLDLWLKRYARREKDIPQFTESRLGKILSMSAHSARG